MASHSSSSNKRGYSFYDYGSEFEPDSDVERKKAARLDLSQKPAPVSITKPLKTAFVEERSKDEARYMRHHYVSTNAYAKHKELVNNYLMYYGGKMSDFNDTSTHRTDRDVIRENHRFVWEEGDEVNSWDKKLAKRYYDKLYKEYCLADLSRYKENKVGMRWRTEKEVISGKGQFICGNKVCTSEDDLKSWEVNFSYVEQEVKKNTLVKLRLCSSCSRKLNYKNKRKEITLHATEEDNKECTSDKEVKKKSRTDADIDDTVNSLLL